MKKGEKVAKKEKSLEPMRHSAAHVMAAAIKRLYGNKVKLAIGPTTEDGYYYDFDFPKGVQVSESDLTKIEAEMEKIIKADLPFKKEEMSVAQALAYEKKQKQDYKVELINDLKAGVAYGEKEEKVGPVKKVSYYHLGDIFTDLCRGPHVGKTSEIGPFKLLSVAGSYWRGDEQRPMLTRIYGTAFPTKKELDQFLKRQEEAEKRDHRKLGRELDLFSIHQEAAGGGLIVWHPKGAIIRKVIEDYWRQRHLEEGYDLVFAPHIGKYRLWETSGHLDFYRENMYAPMDIDGVDYYAKPMNCPYHILVYKSNLRSYRDLPMRLAELGSVYRYERSGVLHGLLRVRGFTIDDAHIFSTPEQMEEEISRAVGFSLEMLRTFGFKEFEIELSVRDPKTPEKYAGNVSDWQMAERALALALKKQQLPFNRMEGEAVFYGPKIDIKVKDALGRSWQCSTIQFDFNMPARFGMSFVDKDGKQHQPYMVHRALLGSLERFFGVLIEHFAGAFPVWLAPVQAIVIPITDDHIPYAKKVKQKLSEKGIRGKVDKRSETTSAKIRDAEKQKIPYMLVVGDIEKKQNSVALRVRGKGDLGRVKIERFVGQAQEAIEKKSLI